jgi:hypothetical protein
MTRPKTRFTTTSEALVRRNLSAAPVGSLDIPISDWNIAGLLKLSIARLDRLVTAEKTLLGRRLGELTAGDQAAIRAAWNQHMRL